MEVPAWSGLMWAGWLPTQARQASRPPPTLMDVVQLESRAEQRELMNSWMRDDLRGIYTRQGFALGRDPTKRELIEDLLVCGGVPSPPPLRASAEASPPACGLT